MQYPKGLIVKVLKRWYYTRPNERIDYSEKKQTWLMPVNALKLDINRALDFMEKEYSQKHRDLLFSHYALGKTRKSLCENMGLSAWKFNKIKNTALGVISQYLEGMWV